MANQRQYESMVWNYLHLTMLNDPYLHKIRIADTFVGPVPQTDAQKSRYNNAYNKVMGQLVRFAGPEEDLL